MQTSELKPTQKLVLSRVCRMCCCSGCLNATDIFEQTARQLQWRKVKVMHRRPYSTVTFDEKNIPTFYRGKALSCRTQTLKENTVQNWNYSLSSATRAAVVDLKNCLKDHLDHGGLYKGVPSAHGLTADHLHPNLLDLEVHHHAAAPHRSQCRGSRR